MYIILFTMELEVQLIIQSRIDLNSERHTEQKKNKRAVLAFLLTHELLVCMFFTV